MNISEIKIVGDSGDEYTITVDPITNAARCSCPSFRFNSIALCKHLAFVAETMSVKAEDATVTDVTAYRAAVESHPPFGPYGGAPYPTRPAGFNARNWD